MENRDYSYHYIADGALKIDLEINNDDNLVVTDYTDYEEMFQEADWYESTMTESDICSYHAILERIVYLDNDKDSEVTMNYYHTVETYEQLRHCAIYDLPKDGHYCYQKIILPTEKHPQSATDQMWYEVTKPEDRTPEEGKVFYRDSNALYKSDELTVLDPVNDFDTIYSHANGEPTDVDNCYSVEKEIFSMYDLIKCYLLKERARIQNYFRSGCKKDCDKVPTNANTEVDILLAAVLVIRNLIEQGDFWEAQRLLNGLHTCHGLCKDYYNNLKGCNCG